MEHKTDEFLRINPAGQVPAIKEENGNDVWLLSESHAILRYLADSRQVADHWYPKDLKTRAMVDRYLDSHHQDMREKTLAYSQAKAFTKKQADIEKWGPKVEALLLNLDKVLGNQTWIAGTDKPSIADLSAWSESEMLSQDIIGVDF